MIHLGLTYHIDTCGGYTFVNFFVCLIFFPDERRKNPLSGPKFRLDITKGLWGLSCVSVSDFDQYNNPILSFFFIYSSLLSVHGM